MALSNLNDNWNFDRRLHVNGNIADDNDNGHAFGIVLLQTFFSKVKTHKNIYEKIYAKKNIVHAYKKARKGKTKKEYVIAFERHIVQNINSLNKELKEEIYQSRELKHFILRDPKTRKISKSHFRDRVVHHALCNIIEPIFDKAFIYDNAANRKGKGSLFAIKRLYTFMRKVSRNGKDKGWFNENQIQGYCLKADIKHYFREINHNILLNILKRKIKDKQTIWLIQSILRERETNRLRITARACHLET